jgi:hypothetical protein
MSAKISSRKEGDILIIKVSGTIKKTGLIGLTNQVYEEITRHGCTRIIIDNSDLEMPTKLIEYVNLEKFYTTNLPSEIRSMKLAVVVSPMYKETGNFWETYCRNRGFGYKAFTSIEDASTYMARLKLK